MILLDAYALIALLAAEPRTAEIVRDVLRREPAAIATVNLLEAIYVLRRERAIAPEGARAKVAALGDRLVPIPLSEQAAWRAAEIRIAHYHRTKRPLSLADCALLASAAPADTIATSDSHVLAVADLEGIQTLALPERGD